MDADHKRPANATNAEVAAAGKVSEALEYVERVRGHFYELHQLIGHADQLFSEGADLLEQAGHAELAHHAREDVVGRNLLHGRWSFQIIEEFDAGYWASAHALETRVRGELMHGRRHVYEAEMKEIRRTHGRHGHESTPQE